MLSRHLPTVAESTLNIALRDVRVAQARVVRSHGQRSSAARAVRISRRAQTTAATSPAMEKLLMANDQFTPRHLGPSPAQVAEMCKVIGVKDVGHLIDETIPAVVRRDWKIEVPADGAGEAACLAELKGMLSSNVIA